MRRSVAAIREVVVLALFALAYGGVRALTEGSTWEAVRNAERVLHAEKAVGLAWEEAVQASTLGSDTAVAVANWVYIWGYFPYIITAAVFIWLQRRDRYVVLRNAVLISGVIGLVAFALFPTAPPRLTGGFVDTILEGSRSYRVIQPPELTNQYAAMPSLHVGWSLLVGITLASILRRPALRALALALPAAMVFAVVATANHFVLDVAAGILVVLVALWISAVWLPRLSNPPATLVRSAVAPLLAIRRRAPRRERPRAGSASGQAGLGPGRG